MSEKFMEKKLQRITNGEYQPDDFLIADAKDGDMAFGVHSASSGQACNPMKTRADYLNAMVEMTQSGLVDVMLMSASSAEELHSRGVFSDSPVTPAVRMNDTTDIWSARGSCYKDSPSRPFATADVETVKSTCNLGLYSMTFSNQLEADVLSLQSYRDFRREMRPHGFTHFLEIFNPAFDIGIPASELGFYINDMIIKAVSGVNSVDAPRFLKIQFNGAESMLELSQYDPKNLVVGILGGSKGTTRDTFELVHQAEQAGARVALFGRKINLAEAPLELVRLMRQTITMNMTPEQAVKEYHQYLEAQQIAPKLSLADDLQVTDAALMQ
ncbi:MAG: hypothetical protein KTR32_11810 [Granulosicoccus sp.]|nr:hypothetical protein [Granulosicoccus sp.]